MTRRLDPGPLGTGPLTKLDERVLAALDGAHSQRAKEIVAALNRHERRYDISPRTSESDVRAVLRGFEHLGRVSGRGGWWRTLPSGGARDDA